MTETVSEQKFRERLQKVSALLGDQIFSYQEEDMEFAAELYAFAEQYAQEKQLLNTALALPLVRGIISQSAGEKDKLRYRMYLKHCLSVCRMLIDLHVDLPEEEEDVLLAASICHILPENDTPVNFDNLEEMLKKQYHLHPEIGTIVRLITRIDGMSDAENHLFYEKIRQNKLALLIRLADRGNLVQGLHSVSNWSAHEYLHETRTYFFPLCIYAKEHYPDLIGPISVLMEKMRCLADVSEILLNRYEARENQLMQEILSLREENSRIRGIIRTLQEEEN